MNLEGDGARCFFAADDDDELAAEEFHRGFGERLQTGGVAVADGLKGTGARDFKGQLVISIGNEGTFGIGQRDGDEGQILAIGF